MNDICILNRHSQVFMLALLHGICSFTSDFLALIYSLCSVIKCTKPVKIGPVLLDCIAKEADWQKVVHM